MYDDASVANIEPLPPTQIHRAVDIEVIDADLAGQSLNYYRANLKKKVIHSYVLPTNWNKIHGEPFHDTPCERYTCRLMFKEFSLGSQNNTVLRGRTIVDPITE